MQKTAHKIKALDIAALLLAAAGFALLLIRAKSAGGPADECFYLTIPLRLIAGDGLIGSEWHLTQLFSVLLYTPVKIYVSLCGGTAGLVLFMRVLFAFFITLAAAAVYIMLKKNGAPALIFALCLMLFAPMWIYTGSYYTLGTAFLSLCLCLIYSQREKISTVKMLLCGFTLSLTVLCNPVFALAYIIYIAAVLFSGKKKLSPVLSRRAALTLSIGILPMLIFFLFLLFKNSTPLEILRTLPYIFTDPEHIASADGAAVSHFAFLSFFSDTAKPSGIVPPLLCALLFIAAAADKKRLAHRKIYVPLLFALLIISEIIFYINIIIIHKEDADSLEFAYIFFSLLCPAAYMLCEKRNRPVFYGIWLPGILFALSFAFSSNLGLNSQVCGHIICFAAALIIMRDLCVELSFKKPLFLLPAALAVFQCGALITDAILGICVYDINRNTVSEGAYKGISLSLSQYAYTEAVREDILTINTMGAEDDRLFICDNFPSGYLESIMKTGAFSSWFIGEQLSFEAGQNRFAAYYRLNPSCVPDYIYIPDYCWSRGYIRPSKRTDTVELLKTLYDGEFSRLENGYVLKVSAVKMK